MGTNPNVSQGTLNRARVSVSFSDYSGYNIAVSNLGTGMVTVSPTTPTAALIPTAAGAATSLNPYQMMDVTIHLNRAQSLANKFESKRQVNCSFGEMVIRGDSTNMQSWTYQSATLINVDTMNLNASETDYILHFQAIYYINSDLWS